MYAAESPPLPTGRRRRPEADLGRHGTQEITGPHGGPYGRKSSSSTFPSTAVATLDRCDETRL